jgi:hypothetical protein
MIIDIQKSNQAECRNSKSSCTNCQAILHDSDKSLSKYRLDHNHNISMKDISALPADRSSSCLKQEYQQVSTTTKLMLGDEQSTMSKSFKCPYCTITFPSIDRIPHRDRCVQRRRNCSPRRIVLINDINASELNININIEVNPECYICKVNKKAYSCSSCKKPICYNCQSGGGVFKVFSWIKQYVQRTFKFHMSEMPFMFKSLAKLSPSALCWSIVLVIFYVTVGWLLDVLHLFNLLLFWLVLMTFAFIFSIFFLFIYVPIYKLYWFAVLCRRRVCVACVSPLKIKL